MVKVFSFMSIGPVARQTELIHVWGGGGVLTNVGELIHSIAGLKSLLYKKMY